MNVPVFTNATGVCQFSGPVSPTMTHESHYPDSRKFVTTIACGTGTSIGKGVVLL